LCHEKKQRRSSLLAGERSDGGANDEIGGELGGAREGERNRSVAGERSAIEEKLLELLDEGFLFDTPLMT
jgi:hypothetical protein